MSQYGGRKKYVRNQPRAYGRGCGVSAGIADERGSENDSHMKSIPVMVALLLAMAGCGATETQLDSPSPSNVNGGIDPNPSADIANTWLGKWCDVQPGMTRTQVRDIMGAPTSELDLDSGAPQMSWYAFQFGFTAFMDSRDVVRQLDVNMLRLTDAEKAQVPCGDTRIAK